MLNKLKLSVARPVMSEEELGAMEAVGQWSHF